MKTNIETLIHKKNLLLSGPCSAETEEQLLATAQQLHATGKVDILRAGIWKPRTNPGGFEGIGVKGLPWLVKAKELTGLPTAVEVATAKHVEDALSFDTDVLWIGARTTVNPFSVQHIADALRGTNATVLIKNPVSADIKLWIGAVERLQAVGITSIGLIHRGFTEYGNTQFRNAPMWHIPIEMKRRFPDLPMICDPSHICGKRDTLGGVIQKSVDLDFDGLMVESHIDPDNAWTDASQQVTPENLAKLLADTTWKKVTDEEADFIAKIDSMRQRINQVDDELLNLLSNRMSISQEIGQLKRDSNVTILQTTRWSEILERAKSKAGNLDISEEFIHSYMEAIHLESIRKQNTING